MSTKERRAEAPTSRRGNDEEKKQTNVPQVVVLSGGTRRRVRGEQMKADCFSCPPVYDQTQLTVNLLCCCCYVDLSSLLLSSEFSACCNDFAFFFVSRNLEFFTTPWTIAY